MSETVPEGNTDKTPQRLEAESTITNRLQQSTSRQRAAMGLCLLAGAGAGVSLHEKQPVPTGILIGAFAALSIARRVEKAAAYNTCDDRIYRYQRELEPPEGMPPEAYSHLLADKLHVKTIISPDDTGDATVERVWDQQSVVRRFDNPVDAGLPLGVGASAMFDTWALSGNMSQPVVWSAVAMGTIAAGAAIGLAELTSPSRDIAPYMRQLDNIDGGGSLHMAPAPETEA